MGDEKWIEEALVMVREKAPLRIQSPFLNCHVHHCQCPCKGGDWGIGMPVVCIVRVLRADGAYLEKQNITRSMAVVVLVVVELRGGGEKTRKEGKRRTGGRCGGGCGKVWPRGLVCS